MELLERHFDTAFDAPDGIKKLRELILTLAMQGKLVPQNPHDPPASELLKKIEVEKKRLVKEGKIREPKPLAPISSDELPFDLPDSWAWVRMGTFTEIIRGITFPSSEKTKTPGSSRIACLRTSNVQKELEWDDLLYIERRFVGRTEQQLRLNDLVMSMANSRELVGKVAIVRHIPVPEATFGGFLGVIRTHLILPPYVHNALNSTYARNSLVESASQTTNIANISLGKLNAFLMPVPPIQEQARIVAKIEELMARCDALEKLRAERDAKRLAVHTTAVRQLLNVADTEGHTQAREFLSQHFGELYTVKENVTELRKAILQLAVMGKLVPQDPNDPPASTLLKQIEAEKKQLAKEGKIRAPKSLPSVGADEMPYDVPYGWAWVRFGLLADFINGDRGKNYPNREEYVSRGVPWINTGHIEPDGTLTKDEMYYITREKFNSLNGGKIQPGDLVYCLRGATFGKTAIVDPYDEGAIASSLMIVRTFQPLSNRYMYYYLIGPIGRQQILRFDNGSAQPNLSANSVKLYVYPLPPIAEQRRIVAKIDQLMSLCDNLEKHIDTARETQSALLNAMMAQYGAQRCG